MTAKQTESRKTQRHLRLFSRFSSVAARSPDILTWDNMFISFKESWAWEAPLSLFLGGLMGLGRSSKGAWGSPGEDRLAQVLWWFCRKEKTRQVDSGEHLITLWKKEFACFLLIHCVWKSPKSLILMHFVIWCIFVPLVRIQRNYYEPYLKTKNNFFHTKNHFSWNSFLMRHCGSIFKQFALKWWQLLFYAFNAFKLIFL